jgi:lysophospholipase L1-like esterase
VALTSFGVHAADGTTFTDTFAAFPRGIAARILAIAAGAAAGLLLGRRRGLVLGALPIAAIPLLEHVDLRGWLDALRLIDVPEALGPLLFAGIPAAVATLLAATASLSLRRALAVGIAPMLAIAAIAAAAGFPHDTAGWLVLAATGLPLAGIGWLNTHPARLRAPLSQALCLLILLMAEGGVRLTALDTTWTRTAGWKRASEEFRELLELENYRTYPDEGFPVRPPPPDPQRRRIVALGGSSTGGAYQMDDIDQFWPKRLEEDLAGTDWEVVNQGVGGWNTLHVRLYVESQIERLDADILALYVGHNDVLAESPVPYRDLYARYAMKGSSLTAISDTLNGSRLYVGLKYAVLALKDRGGAVAVPVPDARENLAAIIDVAHQHHAKVLLMTEGLNPDPLPLRPYAAMQKELAEQTGSLYLDAATALWKTGDPDLFLDDCHLSASGHRELAGDVLATLRDAGWLK